jgi:cytidylate kinase
MKNVITISRQMGSGGTVVTGIIADRLGWPLVRREMITEAAARAGVEDVKIERVFDHRPSLQDRITMQQRLGKYLDAITQVMREYADRGNVVLLGRGANVILADDPRLFRVHIVADLETRIERTATMAGLKGKRGFQEARSMVTDSDYTRIAYYNYLFDADWNDPTIYELVVNSTEMTVEQVAEIILGAFELVRK